MITKTLKNIIASIGLITAAPSFTQETAIDNHLSNENSKQVKISSLKDTELRSYSQLLKGLKVYGEERNLAPDSELFFILIPKTNDVNFQDLKMRLASDGESLNIPVDTSGQFKLPYLETKSDDEYDLILNIPKGKFLIRPYVKSANLQANTKRLGDFRLECQVRWAIEKQDVSTVFNIYVKLLASGNPCTSRTVDVGFYAPNGIDTISLDTRKLKLSKKVNSYERFSLPIWDKDLKNDELIKFTHTAIDVQASQP